MIHFLVRKAYNTCEKNELIPKEKKKVWHKFYYNGLKLALMFAIETSLKIKYRLFQAPFKVLEDDGYKPIVSLTSFPERINSLWIVIHSIFAQDYPPAKVLLVLAIEEFPNKLLDVPMSLKRFLNHGLEIVFIDYNLKSHNKYHYVLQNFKNREIITLDDDLYYWPCIISNLVNLKELFPNCICANTIDEIAFDSPKLLLSRSYKGFVFDTKNVALGVGGVLYPKQFRSEELFNKEKIIRLCPLADDLWLKAQSLLLGINVVTGKRFIMPMLILNSQKKALRFQNVDKNLNLIQWNRLVGEYGLMQFFR